MEAITGVTKLAEVPRALIRGSIFSKLVSSCRPKGFLPRGWGHLSIEHPRVCQARGPRSGRTLVFTLRGADHLSWRTLQISGLSGDRT